MFNFPQAGSRDRQTVDCGKPFDENGFAGSVRPGGQITGIWRRNRSRADDGVPETMPACLARIGGLARRHLFPNGFWEVDAHEYSGRSRGSGLPGCNSPDWLCQCVRCPAECWFAPSDGLPGTLLLLPSSRWGGDGSQPRSGAQLLGGSGDRFLDDGVDGYLRFWPIAPGNRILTPQSPSKARSAVSRSKKLPQVVFLDKSIDRTTGKTSKIEKKLPFGTTRNRNL